MKSFRLFGLLAAAVLCAALVAPAPALAAGPLKRIRSSLQKAGNALNPFKREAQPPPAPAPAPLKLRATAPPREVRKSSAASPSRKTATVVKKPSAAARTKKATAAAATTTLTAAASDRKKTPSKRKGEEEKTNQDEEKLPETAAGEEDVESGESGETPAPAPEVIIRQPLAEIPFGTPVMGRKGQVRSPFAPDQGMVDVSGIPAGKRVKCPFTEKVFRVP